MPGRAKNVRCSEKEAILAKMTTPTPTTTGAAIARRIAAAFIA